MRTPGTSKKGRRCQCRIHNQLVPKSIARKAIQIILSGNRRIPKLIWTNNPNASVMMGLMSNFGKSNMPNIIFALRAVTVSGSCGPVATALAMSVLTILFPCVTITTPPGKYLRVKSLLPVISCPNPNLSGASLFQYVLARSHVPIKLYTLSPHVRRYSSVLL